MASAYVLDRIEEKPVSRVGEPNRLSDIAQLLLGDQRINSPGDNRVCLPTLQLRDGRMNQCQDYSVDSATAQLYEKNKPAIVRINTLDPQSDASAGTTAGSGFIIDKEGIIATGYHVVRNAASLRVKMADNKIYDATIYAVDATKDQALLKITGSNPFQQFPTVELASSSNSVISQSDLLALGFPKGQDSMHLSSLKVTDRLALSRLNISGGTMNGEDPNRMVIRTLGNVKHGNSGGPIFDPESRKVVAIVNLSNEVDTYANPVEDLIALKTKAKNGFRSPSVTESYLSTVQNSKFELHNLSSSRLLEGSSKPVVGAGDLFNQSVRQMLDKGRLYPSHSTIHTMKFN